MNKFAKNPIKTAFTIVGGLFIFGSALGSFYTVDQGDVGVVKRFGKVIGQEDPGLHWKVPYIDGVHDIEIRQRVNTEELAAATANQLPVKAVVSVNWTVDKAAASDLYIAYGGLDQFENRIVDRDLRSTAKAAIAKFRADALVRERNSVVEMVYVQLVESLAEFPITINSVQIENVSLPTKYLEAIEAKERAREDAVREKHVLEKQNLVAQQEVNTANANKEATIARATGEAQATRLKASAEAEAIELVNAQLSKSDNYVDLVRAKRWNGVYPATLMSGNADVLLSLPSK